MKAFQGFSHSVPHTVGTTSCFFFAQEQTGQLKARALKMVKQMSLEENLTKV